MLRLYIVDTQHFGPYVPYWKIDNNILCNKFKDEQFLFEKFSISNDG